MENRKLYHLVNGEFVLNGMPSVYVPTYEEVMAHIAILNDIGCFDDSVAESVTFGGISNGKRTDAVMAEVYDAEFAELIGDHMAEKCRVRNRRKGDRKHKLTPEKRKEQELMRKDRMYGYAWNLDCPKKRFHPESDPIKTRKYAEGDRIIRADYQREFDEDAEAECRAKRFRENVRKEVEYRDSVVRMMEKKIKNLTEIADNLKKMEEPKTPEELDVYGENVEDAYWYLRD